MFVTGADILLVVGEQLTTETQIHENNKSLIKLMLSLKYLTELASSARGKENGGGNQTKYLY